MNSKMKCMLQATTLPKSASFALLVLRLIVGVAFIYHGWGKIQSPFAWMPAGSPVPGFFQFLAAISEFGGGIALIIGLLTRVASFGLVITMIVATAFHAIMLGETRLLLLGQDKVLTNLL